MIVWAGERLRLARERAGISQRKLALKLSEVIGRPVQGREIGRWEDGLYAPNGINHLGLAACLGVVAEEFTTEVDVDEEP